MCDLETSMDRGRMACPTLVRFLRRRGESQTTPHPMIHKITGHLPTLALLALTSACGSSSGSNSAPPSTSTELTIQSISIANGSSWQVNRPIEIVFDRPINMGTVHSGSIHILDSLGVAAGGTFFQPQDAAGQVQTDRLLFQPTCPIQPGGVDAGFTPGGTAYRLSILGANQGGFAILPLIGDPLAETIAIDFSTPNSTDPAVLFFDPQSGPPQVRLRGVAGVAASDFDATYVEVAVIAGGRAYFEYSGQVGNAVLAPHDLFLMGGGLPRNHYSVPANQVGFIFHFDQPVSPEPESLDRVKIEYLDLTWKPVPGRIELLSNCSQSLAGAQVRFKPLGLLPAGTPVRLRLAAGFQDLSGHGTTQTTLALATAPTTPATVGKGIPIDSFSEPFGLAGTTPGSLEDTEVTFGVAKAIWGAGKIAPVFGTNGQSRARSKWIPLGLGRVTAGGTNPTTGFLFEGTDANGVIETVGDDVESSSAFSAPMPLLGLEPRAVTIPLAELASLGEIYLAQPSLLQGYSIRFSHPVQGTFPPMGVMIQRATTSGSSVRLELSNACMSLGLGDCVPLDLTQTYSGPTGVSVILQPRFFQVVTRVIPDRMPADARITILFDATMADSNGDPDPAAALSANGAWSTDISNLPGGAWDFVRFEVFFELDVSGDGWGLFDPLPDLRYLNFGFDQRP